MFASNQSASRVNLENGKVHEIFSHNRNIAVDSTGTHIAAIDYDATFSSTRVSVTDGKGANNRVLYEGSGVAYGVDVSPLGSFVAAATPDRLIRVWQAPDFQQETLVRIPFDADFDSFFISNSGKQLLLQPARNHEVIVLDVATSARVAAIQNVKRILNRSVDGQLLAIWKTDYSVAIYDTLKGHAVQNLAGHANEVVGACFLPSEQLVATISKEGEIVLWALDTGEQLVQFQANFRRMLARKACLAFSSDGHTLVAAGDISIDPAQKITELRAWNVP